MNALPRIAERPTATSFHYAEWRVRFLRQRAREALAVGRKDLFDRLYAEYREADARLRKTKAEAN